MPTNMAFRSSDQNKKFLTVEATVVRQKVLLLLSVLPTGQYCNFEVQSSKRSIKMANFDT